MKNILSLVNSIYPFSHEYGGISPNPNLNWTFLILECIIFSSLLYLIPKFLSILKGLSRLPLRPRAYNSESI